ncbi:hypothetical protein C1N53_16600 [Pontibacter sp. SGAir0037]|nr:YkvA family protein [Pontibacter sp. SGAir0037]QCR23808.1 hypothetical protein C1N53_16600 [Pontibacter sp. SGAir0037]
MENQNQRPDGKRVAQSPFFERFLKKAETYLKHPKKITQLLNDAFQKASAKKSVGDLAAEVWESLLLLSRMIKAAVSGEYQGIPNATIIGGIAVFIYFLSPIDLIPDFIPVIGLLDDASLLAWFMASIKTELDKFKDWEASRPAPSASEPVTEPATPPQTDPLQNADASFGTPKSSNQAAGTVEVNQNPNT